MALLIIPLVVLCVVDFATGSVRAAMSWKWNRQTAKNGIFKIVALIALTYLAALLDSIKASNEFDTVLAFLGGYLIVRLSFNEFISILKGVIPITLMMGIRIHLLSRAVNFMERRGNEMLGGDGSDGKF